MIGVIADPCERTLKLLKSRNFLLRVARKASTALARTGPLPTGLDISPG